MSGPGPLAGGLPIAVVSLAALPGAADPRWGLLSPAELAYCRGRGRAAEHLGARALAREVVARALGWPGSSGPDAGALWRGIALGRAPSGRPHVVLSGLPEARRRRYGVPVPGVSLSHAAGYAGALAWLPGAGP